MACYYPIAAWQTDDGLIVFAERGRIRRSLELPCGRCVGCRLERSRQWAVRCLHESQLHDLSVFVTLTYDDFHVPVDYSLRYRDFQLFMKRLRKCKGPVRFYMCGEYGTRGGRPHYHVCLFGCFFSDRQYFKTFSSGFKLYTSAELSRIWNNGFCSVGDVSFESAAYVARYCIVDRGAEFIVDGETGELLERVREFNRMSLKPGIGGGWYERYSKEVFPADYVVVNGVKCRPPKYYDRLLRRSDGLSADAVDFSRYGNSLNFLGDCTVERLAVRERVTKARLSFKEKKL